MAVVYIKLRASIDQRSLVQEFTLDGIRLRMRSIYTNATGGWSLDFRDSGDALLIAGISVVPGIDLWRPFKHLAIPQGELFWQDTQNRSAATLSTADVTGRLLYREI